MKKPLGTIAHTRSGDKGDTSNIGVIAFRESDYPVLAREVTAERVKRHFGDLVQGTVERFELPNLGALNFLLHGALGGGGTVSLRTDAQGKTTLRLLPGSYNVRLEPPFGMPHLSGDRPLTVAKTPEEQSVNLRLERGAVVEIDAVDAESGAPVAGAQA